MFQKSKLNQAGPHKPANDQARLFFNPDLVGPSQGNHSTHTERVPPSTLASSKQHTLRNHLANSQPRDDPKAHHYHHRLRNSLPQNTTSTPIIYNDHNNKTNSNHELNPRNSDAHQFLTNDSSDPSNNNFQQNLVKSVSHPMPSTKQATLSEISNLSNQPVYSSSATNQITASLASNNYRIQQFNRQTTTATATTTTTTSAAAAAASTISPISTILEGSAQTRDDLSRLMNYHLLDQRDRDSNEMVAMARDELDKDAKGYFHEAQLETLGSLEKDLPIELSFLMRQQAYCMAKMNYLDRQIKELKEANHNMAPHSNSTDRAINHLEMASRLANNTHRHQSNINSSTIAHNKNGNFIPSDDSGGEYSRATISDDDELSSLLDQIAKSVRPDRMHSIRSNISPPQQTMQPRPVNYSVIGNPPHQYTIINPNHLNQQAVPVFVMSSPIAVAHPSSISSTVLPGVHFQPEPRYNQYYEDFYIQNNSSTSTINNQHSGLRSQQFDSKLSAIEQIVSQKEKRQIKSQLKSADNWLKMRSSGLCHLNGDFSNTTNGTVNGVITDVISGVAIDKNLPTSSSSANLAEEISNNLIEENRSR